VIRGDIIEQIKHYKEFIIYNNNNNKLMYMSSSVGSVAYSSSEGIYQVDENESFYDFEIAVIDDVALHPLLLAISHSLILGEDITGINTEESQRTLTDDQFKELKCNQELSNCCICMENKKLNIQLPCKHTFCKLCIKNGL